MRIETTCRTDRQSATSAHSPNARNSQCGKIAGKAEVPRATGAAAPARTTYAANSVARSSTPLVAYSIVNDPSVAILVSGAPAVGLLHHARSPGYRAPGHRVPAADAKLGRAACQSCRWVARSSSRFSRHPAYRASNAACMPGLSVPVAVKRPQFGPTSPSRYFQASSKASK